MTYSLKVHEPKGTYLPLKWDPPPHPPTPSALKRETPLVCAFTETVTGRLWGTDRHLIYHSLRAPVTPVWGALRPWRGWGPGCRSAVLEPSLEQDIALPPCMKRIHHLSLRWIMYSPSWGSRGEGSSRAKEENLQRFCVGLKIRAF